MGQRIIGIDPGSRLTGYGVIDSDGRQSRFVVAGCLKLSQGSLPDRLGEIFRGVSEVIAEFRPTVMSVEDVFMAKNAASALKLGQARGAAICAGMHHGLGVYEYAPREVKQAVVGTGAADKAQVQHMMALLLSLKPPLQADSADALAVALCHAHGAGLNPRMTALSS